MKIAWFRKNISPEIGAYLAGYTNNDQSVAKLDDLFACGLCIDDGKNRVLLVSFDLLGLDGWFIRKVRKNLAVILQVPDSAVLLTCTHTHTGPHTRSVAARPDMLNRAYLERLETILTDAVTDLPEFRECRPAFFSGFCDENRNRRYTAGDNHCTYTPFRHEVVPGATGFADKELGALYFFDPATGRPLYVIGNYAAHPLAGHTPGLGGLRISADYPGAFRNYVTGNTGAEAMFISGAAGDLVPKEDEMGDDAFRSLGIRLGKQVISGMVEAERNPNRYGMPDAAVGSCIRKFSVPFRRKYRDQPNRLPEAYLGKEQAEMEIQCVAVGDVCWVGVPGELCCELGQEIKWHSPFRRTFIAYNATDYMSYLCPANFLVSGGYEAMSQRISAKGGLALVNTASEALFDLREKLFPSVGDPYPNDCPDGLVHILPNA